MQYSRKSNRVGIPMLDGRLYVMHTNMQHHIRCWDDCIRDIHLYPGDNAFRFQLYFENTPNYSFGAILRSDKYIDNLPVILGPNQRTISHMCVGEKSRIMSNDGNRVYNRIGI